MTSEKQKLIQSLIEMQKKFISYEHDQRIELKDYFAPDDEHPLAGYVQEYADMANQLIDMAHEEKASKR
ncbi:hypothetical protein N9H39_07910 [Gammaproteobacteria bacterium]|jgi:hypothetical protein|nr:hypothetical protein [Gammaproteobacteria bacterium]